jgi:hypothetical protein
MRRDDAAQLVIPEDSLVLMPSLYDHPNLDRGRPPVLKPEVEEWCRATLTAGTYRTEWVQGVFKPGSTADRLIKEGAVITPDHSSIHGPGFRLLIAVHIDVPLIRFSDQRDQVAFRLRWGDVD